MLAVFYGSDRAALTKRASEYIETLGADEVISFDEMLNNFSDILNFAEQGALFGGSKVIRMDGVLENQDVSETLIENLERLSVSESTFVFIESRIPASDLKIIRKFASIVEEFKMEEKKTEKFNIFSLADALARRDKKSLWVLYQKALRAGKSPEEISGTIFWQLKTMMILQGGGSKTLSPFVVSKNRNMLKNYKEGELDTITKNLITKYHEARRGRGDMETALERFVLTI